MRANVTRAAEGLDRPFFSVAWILRMQNAVRLSNGVRTMG
jgi:hypothetical protein